MLSLTQERSKILEAILKVPLQRSLACLQTTLMKTSIERLMTMTEDQMSVSVDTCMQHNGNSDDSNQRANVCVFGLLRASMQVFTPQSLVWT